MISHENERQVKSEEWLEQLVGRESSTQGRCCKPSPYGLSTNQLKHKIIVILRLTGMDKAANIRQLLCPKALWINDKDVNNCHGCDRAFVPLLVWRHHCRFCGKVFCDDCDSNVLAGDTIGYEEKKLRHCNPCKMKIAMVLNEQPNIGRQSIEHSKAGAKNMKIEIEDPDTQSEDRKTVESLRCLINEEKMALQQLAIALLRNLARELCVQHGVDPGSWEVRLAELAWKAVLETKPEIFIRREAFDLQEEIKVIMIMAPPETVTAVCVKGLVLERNIPSKHFEPHLKYPRIITIRPAIEAGSLTQTKNMKFDELVNNVDSILKTCLQKVFRLNPNIMFVQEEVSQIAIELALERRIMIISKVKHHELEKIERLAWIRKRVENLFHIDRDQIAEIIGCCERIYFKTVRQGQMLMFIEHEAGIRTVIIGDTSEASNNNLKRIFDLLLKAAWNLKSERELAIRDTKLCPDRQSEAWFLATKGLIKEKYRCRDSFLESQEVLISKMKYSFKKADLFSKGFQQYCKLRGRKGLFDPCGGSTSKLTQLYSKNQYSLGTFLLKLTLENIVGCETCENNHFYRFFLDDFCISITNEVTLCGKSLKFADQVEEDQEIKRCLQSDYDKESSRLVYAINKFLNIFEMEELGTQPKLQFFMYFRCEDCCKMLGNTKINVGNDLLLMGMSHFCYLLANSYSKSHERSEQSTHTEEENKCQHVSISRVFEFPSSVVRFTVTKVQKYIILPILLNQAILNKLDGKDETMVSDLFCHILLEKGSCIDILEGEMSKLPFSGGFGGVALSLSIAGASALEHAYFEPFIKIEAEIITIKSMLREIEDNLPKYIEEGVSDWTITMRKFAKIDHVIKVAFETLNFISNALRKQKISETYQASEELSFMMSSPVFDDKSTRKGSEDFGDSEMLKKSSVSSFMKIRKETNSHLLETDLDTLMKKMKKMRYLRFQGTYLYYPIANIDDAVSLLTCFLNTDEFRESLKEPTYRDEIIMKLPFTKEMKNDWKPFLEVKKVYRDLTKEEYGGWGEAQDIEFSVYYHREFEELRTSEGIGFRLFIRSLYGCQSWDSSGGKSNSSFSKAHNETLVVKIINDKQFVEFQKFVRAYLKYMKLKRESGGESYLAKIYGIYEVNIRSKVYKCVVMQNVFFGLDSIQKVYDLKGSEVNRLAPAKGTGLDTNFILDRDGYPYLLQPELYEKAMGALVEDAAFLKDQGVIDYSLMVIESGSGLRMAIIDFMRPYHFVQKIENLYKEIKNGKDPTVIPPQQYAQRFVRAMKRYFGKSGRG